MANEPFSRTIVNPLERPVSDDIDQLQSTLDYALRYWLNAATAHRTSNTSDAAATVAGFVGDGFRLVPSGPSGSILMKAGLGLQAAPSDVPTSISSVVGVDDRAALKPIVLLSDVTIPVSAPPGSNSRLDLIEVKYKRATESQTKDLFNTISGVFGPATLPKALTFAISAADLTVNGSGAINYKTGVAGATPARPAVDSGYMIVGYVLVASGSSSYDADVILNERVIVRPNGATRVAGSYIMDVAGGGIATSAGVQGPAGTDIFLVLASGGTGVMKIVVPGAWTSAVGLAGAMGADGPTAPKSYAMAFKGIGELDTLVTGTAADIANAAKNPFGAQKVSGRQNVAMWEILNNDGSTNATVGFMAELI